MRAAKCQLAEWRVRCDIRNKSVVDSAYLNDFLEHSQHSVEPNVDRQ